jgi:hypothetical protein
LIFGGFAKFSTFGFECVAKDMDWWFIAKFG